MRLEKELALIGCANEILLQGLKPYINTEIVLQYIHTMEIRSGYVLMPGFSQDSLEWLLSRHEDLFQHDLKRSDEAGQETYRILFEGGRDEQAIERFVQKMIVALDPSVSYPLYLLEDMRLLPALQGAYT